MSVDPLAEWYLWPVLIERFKGRGSSGDVYATGTTEMAMVDDTTRLVTSTDGQQITSQTTLALADGTVAIPPGSRVTLPATFGGRRTVVIATSVGNSGGLPTPDHVELALQ